MIERIAHIRKHVIYPRRGNQFYKDRTDYTWASQTLCGDPVTSDDFSWNSHVEPYEATRDVQPPRWDATTGECARERVKFYPCKKCLLVRDCGAEKDLVVRA